MRGREGEVKARGRENRGLEEGEVRKIERDGKRGIFLRAPLREGRRETRCREGARGLPPVRPLIYVRMVYLLSAV